MHYLHTKERKEVDFALTRDHKVEKIIEVKHANHIISPSLIYFHEKYNLPAVQVVKELKREYHAGSIEVVKGENFLKHLDL
ncbi:MAG: hypothetical protein KDK44_02215 [Chlamydiia bacterium]|nr:hypothetical protein [Chlamydiia bacterium]